MTFSILVRDRETGAFGGAAMTGSLCVGGWVLRGHPHAGMSASQGTVPSTLWGEDILAAMQAGRSAPDALAEITSRDSGRAHRQLAALDVEGRTAGFTGASSIPAASVRQTDNLVAAGNMLASIAVLDAALSSFANGGGALPFRLMAALEAAADAGGDRRGLSSAAMLVVSRTMAPLDLRIDLSTTPLPDLRKLLTRSQTPPYSDWISGVPTLADPYRAPAAENE